MSTAESMMNRPAVLREAEAETKTVETAPQAEKQPKAAKSGRRKAIGTAVWIAAFILIAGWLLFPVHSFSDNYETWRAPLYVVVRWNYVYSGVQKVGVYAFPHTMKTEEKIWNELEAPQVGMTMAEMDSVEGKGWLKMGETRNEITEWQEQENKRQNTENFNKRQAELEAKKQAAAEAES